MNLKQATKILWIFLAILLVIAILFPDQLVGTIDTMHWVSMTIAFVMVLVLEALILKKKVKKRN
jgi:Na+/pantothenate symporter